MALLLGAAAVGGPALAQSGQTQSSAGAQYAGRAAGEDPRAPYDPYAAPARGGDDATPYTPTGDEIPPPRRPQRERRYAQPSAPQSDVAEAIGARADARDGAPREDAMTEDAAYRGPSERYPQVTPGSDEAQASGERAEAPQEAAPRAPQEGAAFSRKIMESASAYLRYMKKAGAISGSYADSAGVESDVKVGASYEARQFQEGAIAAAAIVALQDRAFVEGVQMAFGGERARADAFAAQILANPAAVLSVSGSDTAAARASAALRRQGDRLLAAGVRVKRASYEVQHQSWSKGDIAAPEARLAGAKTLSALRLSPAREETEKLLKVVLTEEGAAPLLSERSASPVVVRALALAALAVMGEAGQSGGERALTLLSDEGQGECLKMAKLNLFQCLAVAGPHYEDLFCLGQHALMDTAQCVIKASGIAHSLTTASAASPERAMSAPSEDYWVPVGGRARGPDARGGPEGGR
jgi:hypothetical protein